MNSERPLIGCIVNEKNYTFNFLKATKEGVINVPTVELAQELANCGATSGRHIDKFNSNKLTTESATGVNIPLIQECYANLECRVIDMKMVPQYNLFILEVIHARIDSSLEPKATLHHQGNGGYMVAGKIINVSSGEQDF